MDRLKINIDKERELNLSSDAVEIIEEKYDKPFSEIVGGKLTAKLVNSILYSSIIEKESLTEDQFKKELAKKYSYTEAIELMNKLIGEDDDPKKTEVKDTETQS
jgi:spore coat protein CotH